MVLNENEGLERRRFLEKLHPHVTICYDITLLLITRSIMLTQAIFVIYFLVKIDLHYAYLVLIVGLLAIVLDSIYIIIHRKGREYLW